QTGVARPASVVDERDDRLECVHRELRHPAARPREVHRVGRVRRELLPQQRIARRRDSERGEPRDVVVARFVTGLGELIAHAARVDPRDGRFGRRPDLDAVGPHAATVRASSANVTSADATTWSMLKYLYSASRPTN